MVTSTKSTPQIKKAIRNPRIFLLLPWLVGWLVRSGLASSLRAKLGDTTDGLMEGLLTEGEARASGPLGGST